MRGSTATGGLENEDVRFLKVGRRSVGYLLRSSTRGSHDGALGIGRPPGLVVTAPDESLGRGTQGSSPTAVDYSPSSHCSFGVALQSLRGSAKRWGGKPT